MTLFSYGLFCHGVTEDAEKFPLGHPCRDNSSDAEYVKPSGGDVWEFISEIKKWIENP